MKKFRIIAALMGVFLFSCFAANASAAVTARFDTTTSSTNSDTTCTTPCDVSTTSTSVDTSNPASACQSAVTANDPNGQKQFCVPKQEDWYQGQSTATMQFKGSGRSFVYHLVDSGGYNLELRVAGYDGATGWTGVQVSVKHPLQDPQPYAFDGPRSLRGTTVVYVRSARPELYQASWGSGRLVRFAPVAGLGQGADGLYRYGVTIVNPPEGPIMLNLKFQQWIGNRYATEDHNEILTALAPLYGFRVLPLDITRVKRGTQFRVTVTAVGTAKASYRCRVILEAWRRAGNRKPLRRFRRLVGPTTAGTASASGSARCTRTFTFPRYVGSQQFRAMVTVTPSYGKPLTILRTRAVT
jgi:hypothetical protein